MATNIEIRPADGTWVVRAAGAVLGESGAALELIENGRDPVIYFPRDDISMAFFDRSSTISHCPYKGDATHFDLVAKSGTVADAAWSYEMPNDAVSQIGGYVAFYGDKVAIERV